MKYLLTYKWSQDFLEMFFGQVRSRFGHNNNPSCRQFVFAYKRLLTKNQIKLVNGNCIAQDHTALLSCVSILGAKKTKVSIDTEDGYDFSNLEKVLDEIVEDREKNINLNYSPVLEQFKDGVIGYIAGFVVKKIVEKDLLKCVRCADALVDPDPDSFLEEWRDLTNVKRRGYLYDPSIDVFKVCKTTEDVITTMVKAANGSLPGGNKTALRIEILVLKRSLEDRYY